MRHGKRHRPEQIIAKLREIEGCGDDIDEMVRAAENHPSIIM